MDVAIRGDRTSCLTIQLGPRTWLLAVAQGFGTIDGEPTARAALSRLRIECERRVRGERFRRAVDRPQAAATALLGVLARVNRELFMRGAAHDDYGASAASFTATLIVRGRAYVVHAGSTAAYLIHCGEAIALTSSDALDIERTAVLSRALGATRILDVTVSSVTLDDGDAIVLSAHAVRGALDERAVRGLVENASERDGMLAARYSKDDALGMPLARPLRAAWDVRFFAGVALIVFGCVLLTAGYVL